MVVREVNHVETGFTKVIQVIQWSRDNMPLGGSHFAGAEGRFQITEADIRGPEIGFYTRKWIYPEVTSPKHGVAAKEEFNFHFGVYNITETKRCLPALV